MSIWDFSVWDWIVVASMVGFIATAVWMAFELRRAPLDPHDRGRFILTDDEYRQASDKFNGRSPFDDPNVVRLPNRALGLRDDDGLAS